MLTREFVGLLCILGVTAVMGVSVRQTGSCPFNNIIIANGATYATTVNGRCMRYICQGGTLLEIEFACYFDNKCFLEGETYQHVCHLYRCLKSGSLPSVVYTMAMVQSIHWRLDENIFNC